MTSAEMRFFWLLLSTRNCSGKHFTHICKWKRRFHSSGSLGSSLWILVVATMALDPHQLFYSLCHSLFLVLSQDQKMHLIWVPLVRPPTIFWPDTHLCYEWGYYEIHTTSLCPSSDLWCCSEFPRFGLSICFAVQGHLSLASDLQIQFLASSA